jgi:hypothetical protein
VRDELKRWAAKASESCIIKRCAVATRIRDKGRRDGRRRGRKLTLPNLRLSAQLGQGYAVSAKYVSPQTDAELARRLKEVGDILPACMLRISH